MLKYAHFSRHDNPYVDAQFQREWEVQQRNIGAGTVTVFHFDHDDKDHPYLFLPLVQSPTLQELKKQELGWSQLKLAIRAVVKSLVRVHQKAVVHRDLKPSNIFIDDPLSARLFDFGLALIDGLGQRPSDAEMAIGTPYYISPEQAFGELSLQGPASDLYSLGVILFEFIFGKLPFLGKSREETLEMHCYSPVNKDLIPIINDVPRFMIEATFGLLEKAPANRLQHEDFLALLARDSN